MPEQKHYPKEMLNVGYVFTDIAKDKIQIVTADADYIQMCIRDRFYQKITDLYATAIDYDKTALATRRFYATVQNKMHFAVPVSYTHLLFFLLFQPAL